MKALQQQITTLESKVNEILSILKGQTNKKAEKPVKVVIPAGEIVTVVSDIKKVAAKKAAPKKEAAAKVAKKSPAKKTVAKKVAKKTTKK